MVSLSRRRIWRRFAGKAASSASTREPARFIDEALATTSDFEAAAQEGAEDALAAAREEGAAIEEAAGADACAAFFPDCGAMRTTRAAHDEC